MSVTYVAVLPVRDETVEFLAGLLAAERARRGYPHRYEGVVLSGPGGAFAALVLRRHPDEAVGRGQRDRQVLAAVARIPAHLGEVMGDLVDPVSVAFGLFFGGLLTFAAPAAMLPRGHQLSTAERHELDALLSKDPTTLTRAQHKRIEALLGIDPTTAGPPPMKTAPRVLTDAEQREVEALLDKDPSQLTPADRTRLTQLLGSDPTDIGGFEKDPTQP
jgi:hypothetical protein